MSFGQNFAYSKTKEQDVALMIAAQVEALSQLLGLSWHPELLQLDGSLHVQAQQRGNSHHQPCQELGKAYGSC